MKLFETTPVAKLRRQGRMLQIKLPGLPAFADAGRYERRLEELAAAGAAAEIVGDPKTRGHALGGAVLGGILLPGIGAIPGAIAGHANRRPGRVTVAVTCGGDAKLTVVRDGEAAYRYVASFNEYVASQQP